MSSTIVTAASAVITAMIIWFLQDRFRRRGILFWNTLPRAQFFIPPTPSNPGRPLPVHAETIAMQNIGGETLEDVTVVLSHPPQEWQLRVTPNRPFEARKIAEGNHSINLGALGRNEFLTISVHYYDNAPRIIQVRTKEGIVHASQMFFARVLRPWQIATNLTFQIIGLFTVVLLIFSVASAVGPMVVEAISDWVVRTLNENGT